MVSSLIFVLPELVMLPARPARRAALWALAFLILTAGSLAPLAAQALSPARASTQAMAPQRTIGNPPRR